MKKALIVPALLLLAISCGQSLDEETWTAAQVKTLAGIAGIYSVEQILWDGWVDVANSGMASSNLLFQMQEYGWSGVQSVNTQGVTYSVLDYNNVMLPRTPDGIAQVDLYVPFFRIEPDSDYENPLPYSPLPETCNIEMGEYEFYYSVGRDGSLELDNKRDIWQITRIGLEYHDIELTFEPGGYIWLTAHTKMYDYVSSSWQEGTIRIRWARTVSYQEE